MAVRWIQILIIAVFVILGIQCRWLLQQRSAFIRDGEKMEVEGAAKVKSYHDEAFR